MPRLALIPLADRFPPIETQAAVADRDELGAPQRREYVGGERLFAMLEVSYRSRDALAILLEDQPQLAGFVRLRIPIADDLDRAAKVQPVTP